jgi:hypothetical protein
MARRVRAIDNSKLFVKIFVVPFRILSSIYAKISFISCFDNVVDKEVLRALYELEKTS